MYIALNMIGRLNPTMALKTVGHSNLTELTSIRLSTPVYFKSLMYVHTVIFMMDLTPQVAFKTMV